MKVDGSLRFCLNCKLIVASHIELTSSVFANAKSWRCRVCHRLSTSKQLFILFL